MPGHADAKSLFGQPRAEVEAALPDREAVACPLCQTVPRPFGIDFQGLHLARCATCGLEFQHPRPIFEQLATAVYGAAYHPPGEELIGSTRAWHFNRQLSRLERLVPPDRRRMLDVGCGAGSFMRFARRRAWHVDGTDVTVTGNARDAGGRIWEGQLPGIDFGDARFDVVRFNHVLEHTPDPLTELRRARALVTAGGVLLIGVPNMAGASIRLKSWQSRLGLKGRPWKHYGALHHLWFFTPRTLNRLVETAGFAVEHWETPVAGRPGRPALMTALIRTPLETLRAGGLLDLYARVA